MNYNRVSKILIPAIEKAVNPPEGIPLPWWPKLSKMIGGLRPHEITLFCAGTGTGKTSTIAQISAQLCELGVAHYAAPVETGDEDFAVRVASALVNHDMNDGEPIPYRVMEKFKSYALPILEKAPLFIATHDNRVAVKDMITELAYMNQRHGVRVALLDNLNFFLEVGSSHMERAIMDDAIHQFVMMSKHLPMHIILIVHPRKTENRISSEYDLKGSSTAVQECWNVLIANRPRPEDIESGKRDITDREFMFCKIRKRGRNAYRPLWLNYSGARLTEMNT